MGRELYWRALDLCCAAFGTTRLGLLKDIVLTPVVFLILVLFIQGVLEMAKQWRQAIKIPFLAAIAVWGCFFLYQLCIVAPGDINTLYAKNPSPPRPNPPSAARAVPSSSFARLLSVSWHQVNGTEFTIEDRRPDQLPTWVIQYDLVAANPNRESLNSIDLLIQTRIHLRNKKLPGATMLKMLLSSPSLDRSCSVEGQRCEGEC